MWRENLDEIAPFAGDTLAPDELHDITSFGQRFLGANLSLIDQRASSDRVRDCHGDLRSDSIHSESDGHICMTDCIEFSDRLRRGDVAGDIAFLAGSGLPRTIRLIGRVRRQVRGTLVGR